MKTTVVNRKYEKFDVYIGRGSIWGNPFIINVHGDRNAVISNYKERFVKLRKDGFITDTELLALEGKRLGCYCAPLACHGDVLVEAINEIHSTR